MITVQKILTILEPMIEAAKHRSDDLRQNLEEGSQGGYSEELNEAIQLVEELQVHVRHRLPIPTL